MLKTRYEPRRMQRVRAGVIPVVCMAVLAGVIAGWSAGPADRPTDPISSIANFPASIDAVIVIENATRLRASEPGIALLESFQRAGLLAKTIVSWGDFARELGWTSGEAFDALLGRRVSLLLDDLDRAAGPRWVLLAEVDRSAEDRIRRRLELTPRTIAHGARVLAGERGRIHLAIIPGGARGKVSSLMLTSSEHEAFFWRVLASITDPKASAPRLRDTRGYRELQRLERRSVRVLIQPGARVGTVGGFCAVSAALSDDGFTAHWRTSLDAFGIQDAMNQGVQPWSREAFDSVSDDALIAVMGVGPSAFGVVGRFVATMLNIDDEDGEWPTLGPVRLLAVHRGDGGKPGVALPGRRDGFTRVRVTLATQTGGSESAAEADGAIAGFVSGIGTSDSADALDLGGAFPGAVRSVRVTLNDRVDGPWFEGLGSNPRISWAQSLPAQARGGGSVPWLVVELDGGDSSQAPDRRVASLINALSAAQVPTDRGTMVSLGVVRPHALVRWITTLGLDPTSTLTPISSVESLRWEAWSEGGDVVIGQAEVVMRRGAVR